jgi:hypothetical protein
MADLGNLQLTDVLSLGAALRSLGTGGVTSMEDVSKRVVDVLFHRMTRPASSDPALALVRLYKTHTYSDLTPDLQAFARDVLGNAPPPDSKCLVLLATRGTEPRWNDRHNSAGHKAIPLPDPEFLSRLPMVAEVLRQFGVDAHAVLRPSAATTTEMERRQFDVFLVPQARGASCIPAQEEFVERCGIESVLAFGGALPNGDLFVAILFSRVPIPRHVGDMFAPLALGVKVSLLAQASGRLLSNEASP